jgi:hypothetical protein
LILKHKDLSSLFRKTTYLDLDLIKVFQILNLNIHMAQRRL